MTERPIKPLGRGFLFLDSHPAGCARLVRDLTGQVEARTTDARPVALVIGFARSEPDAAGELRRRRGERRNRRAVNAGAVPRGRSASWS